MLKCLGKPIQAGKVLIPNRFMRSATCEMGADEDGMPTRPLLRLIERLGQGQVGLVVPGYVYVNRKGKGMKGMAGLENEQQAKAWEGTIQKVHDSGMKFAFQLAHCGRLSMKGEMKGPNQLVYPEIKEIVEDFRKSAIYAEQAGADAVQLHAAHFYLLSEFLSPTINRRRDMYGGSIENRVAIVNEVVSEIKRSTKLSVYLKINGEDHSPWGNNADASAEIVRQIADVDMFEISCGILGTIRNAPSGFVSRMLDKLKPCPYFEGYNLPAAAIIKRRNPTKVIASVGGWRHVDKMSEAVSSGECDMISMSRPFLREPDLVKRILNGKTTRADCISCGQCFSISSSAFGKQALVKCRFPPVK